MQELWHSEGFNVHRFKFLLWRDRTEETTHPPNIYGAVTRIWPGWNKLGTAPQGGGQAKQEPKLAKPPTVEAEREENPAQGRWQEAQHAGNRNSGKRTQQKAHMAQSQIPEDLRLR